MKKITIIPLLLASAANTNLQEVQVPIVSQATCVERYGGIVLDTNICAGGEQGKDACGVSFLP